MSKTYKCLETDCIYSCRVDDDLFIPKNLWIYLIENINLLSLSDVSFLSPIFSTSIPTIDLFIDLFLSEEDKNIIHNIFLKDNIPCKPWHPFCDYTQLNNFIKTQSKWDVSKYYSELWKVDNLFKGIHPIRFSKDANLFLTQKIIQNFDKVINQTYNGFYKIESIHNTHPFMFRTDLWKEAVKVKYDNFDEISMNKYSLDKNLKTLVVNKGFAIHMCYNHVPGHKEIEQLYYSLLN
jgi:hypothetical protein